jgi:hypothetical protein
MAAEDRAPLTFSNDLSKRKKTQQMNTTSKYTIRKNLYLASFAFALSLGGCYDTYQAPEHAGEPSTGGSTSTPSSTGGLATTGGNDSIPDPPEGDAGNDGASGGQVSGQGGSTASGGSATTGGTFSTGGAGEISATGGSLATGGKAATGGSTATGGTSVGGAATGGSADASGGVEQGGAPATGGAAQGGTGGAPVVEVICVDEEGAPVPYDYSFGLMSEYAFELSMNCDVGGYLMPLVLADPEQLSLVNGFVVEATDWYRTAVLNCQGESSRIGPDEYGLLPPSESSALSNDDFDASMALLMSVIDRHDGQPDAVSATKKDKIKKHIKSVKTKAVNNHTAGLTKTLSEPDCIPTAPPGG